MYIFTIPGVDVFGGIFLGFASIHILGAYSTSWWTGSDGYTTSLIFARNSAYRTFRLLLRFPFAFTSSNCDWLKYITWLISTNSSCCLQKQMKIKLHVEKLYPKIDSKKISNLLYTLYVIYSLTIFPDNLDQTVVSTHIDCVTTIYKWYKLIPFITTSFIVAQNVPDDYHIIYRQPNWKASCGLTWPCNLFLI